MKVLWWTDKRKQWNQSDTIVFECPPEVESQKQTMIISIPSPCFELGNIDSLTPHLKNVIPPRHSKIRLIRNQVYWKASKSIQLIFIPASLLKIGQHAFFASQVKYLLFARNARIQFINQYAFSGTTDLHSVQFPLSIEKFGEHMFYNSSIKSISFPFIIQVEPRDFKGCKQQNSNLQSIDRNSFCRCTRLTSIEIPFSVKEILSYAFLHSSCRSITFAPNSQLEMIGKGAFGSCSNLFSFTVPSSVKEIGESAFYNSNLHSIYFELNSKLTKFSRNLFQFCTKLQLISIPANVEEIDAKAFANSNVNSVLFAPDSKLRKIGKKAFLGCALGTICIPSSVESIEDGAFEDCAQLTSVVIPADSRLQMISSSAFEGCLNLQTIESPFSTILDTNVDPPLRYISISSVSSIPSN